MRDASCAVAHSPPQPPSSSSFSQPPTPATAAPLTTTVTTTVHPQPSFSHSLTPSLLFTNSVSSLSSSVSPPNTHRHHLIFAAGSPSHSLSSRSVPSHSFSLSFIPSLLFPLAEPPSLQPLILPATVHGGAVPSLISPPFLLHYSFLCSQVPLNFFCFSVSFHFC